MYAWDQLEQDSFFLSKVISLESSQWKQWSDEKYFINQIDCEIIIQLFIISITFWESTTNY